MSTPLSEGTWCKDVAEISKVYKHTFVKPGQVIENTTVTTSETFKISQHFNQISLFVEAFPLKFSSI